ncbi:MAG: hypothetical protein VST69_09640, partial [Nitrospirota bacterium]|nr:hypothetical protein [Nitrospirota bacterium]
LKEQQKKFRDSLGLVKQKQALGKKILIETDGSSDSSLTAALAVAGKWDSNEKEIDSKNKMGTAAKPLKSEKEP